VQGWCQGRTQACQIPVVRVFAFGAPAANPVTPSVLAQHQRRWMAPRSSALDPVCPTRMETDTASRPIPPLGAHEGHAPTIMHARSAPQVTISPLSVPKCWDDILTRPKGTDPCRVVTPLRADRWAAKLAKWGSYDQFGDVVHGIQHGFNMGVWTPVTHTYNAPNHKSAMDNLAAIYGHIEEELWAGRYLGLFTRTNLEECICHKPAPQQPLSCSCDRCACPRGLHTTHQDG
jgi:hypothetical protein